MIARHYELGVSETATKAQLKKSIIEHLREEELLSDTTNSYRGNRHNDRRRKAGIKTIGTSRKREGLRGSIEVKGI